MAYLTLARNAARSVTSGVAVNGAGQATPLQLNAVRQVATFTALNRSAAGNAAVTSDAMVKHNGQGYLAVRHDSGLSIVGAGLAATAVGGACGGVGQIWSSYLSGQARNPSLAGNLRTDAFMGVAVVEVMLMMALGFAGYLSSR